MSTESVQQLINVRLHFHQTAFSKEDNILIKNLQQLKGYTATRFLRQFRTENWTRAQILTILKRTVIQTYIILLNKPYFGLLYANKVV